MGVNGAGGFTVFEQKSVQLGLDAAPRTSLTLNLKCKMPCPLKVKLSYVLLSITIDARFRASVETVAAEAVEYEA